MLLHWARKIWWDYFFLFSLSAFVGCLMVIVYLFAPLVLSMTEKLPLQEGEASPTATEAPTEAWICGWAP